MQSVVFVLDMTRIKKLLSSKTGKTIDDGIVTESGLKEITYLKYKAINFKLDR